MYRKLVLKNDFHNSEAVFRVRHFGEIEVDDIIELSAGQVKKAQRLLCGIESCVCSGEIGIRGRWHELDSKEINIEDVIQYDRQTGQVTGARLYIHEIW